MRFAKVLETLGAGTVVYAIVAACSGGGGGGGGGLVEGGAGSGGFGGGVGGGSFLDALTDPVSEAQAAPPEIKEAPCDIIQPFGGGNYYYAEVQFPGRSADELARASALIHYANGTGTGVTSAYSYYQQPSFVRDGAVMVQCWVGDANPIDKVRVVVPAP